MRDANYFPRYRDPNLSWHDFKKIQKNAKMKKIWHKINLIISGIRQILTNFNAEFFYRYIIFTDI